VAGFRTAFGALCGIGVLRFRRDVVGAGARLFDGLHGDPVPVARRWSDGRAGNKKAAEGGFRLFGGAGDGNNPKHPTR